jgi:hypothetical protein
MWELSEIERLYDAIYHRKSIRKFKPEPVAPEVLKGIMQKTKGLTALHPESKVVFRILSGDEVKATVKAKGKVHHLVAYGTRSLETFVNSAFMLQQMDLWLSAQGFGSWWRGAHPKSGFETADGLPYAFMLTFGIPDEELHRKDSSEFKRNSLSSITDTTGMEKILEPVRLAPTAINRLPFFIKGDARSLRVHGEKDNMIMKVMFKDLMYIDLGIGLCHLWLAALKENKFASFERESNQESISGKYEYIWTVHLKS